MGGTVNDRFLLAGGTVSGSIDGNIGTDFFTADNVASEFVITGLDQGTVTGIGQGFTNIDNLTGGTADDTFTLASGTLTGAIDGSTGTDPSPLITSKIFLLLLGLIAALLQELALASVTLRNIIVTGKQIGRAHV